MLTVWGCEEHDVTFRDDSFDDKVVVLQPVEFQNETLIDSVKSAISRYYGYRIHVNESIQFPERAFVNVKSPRFRADTMLHAFSRGCPDSVAVILGVTNKDISTTKRNPDGSVLEPKSRYEDWGVFGLGRRPGNASIISTFRVKGGSKLQIERMQKIALHELGHNLGLKHCPSEGCVMRDAAEKISTIDQVKAQLCENCLKEID